MALSATMYHFQISLSDVERGVYTEIDLRVARHPSESFRYMMTRTLAYALLFEEGIAFSKGGLSASEEAPLSVRDRTGALEVWICNREGAMLFYTGKESEAADSSTLVPGFPALIK